ncbi:MAG TPA: GNAT family N-acetyltransferase [Kineosporiaceae bacterium]|nr:GNAT family N-acetyltransferase [Kineosporiaceae bacterium]
MARRLAPLTLDTLPDLPDPCRGCVVWELDPVAARRATEVGDTAFEKEAWVSATLLEWGSCGRIAYVDDDAAGFVLYAPPAFVPRSMAFPTSPVSGDAVLLMAARIRPEHRGGGLARMLVQGAAKDLTRRGVRAIEAFGLAAAAAAAEPEESESSACLVPADFLLSVGFKTVRQHHRYPRLRLDLKTALSWREDVEQALERILGSVRPPALTTQHRASH